MTLIKSLLLGSAAGIVAVASAQAADLPTKKGAPAAEYVRICSINVGGTPIVGFTIPGSDTCLKISGYGSAQYTIPDKANSTQNAFGMYMRGQVNLDAVSNTGAGPLLAHIEFQDNYGVGFDSQYGSGSYNTGLAESFSWINSAYITWAGMTAGKHGSFYDFFAGGPAWDDFISPDHSGNPINLIAYTVSVGGGFSATLSIEQPENDPSPGATTEFRAPDIVGQFKLTQGWGVAQLSGVAHDDNYVTGASDTWGFGVLGGLTFNIPGMAGGDFRLQGVYAYDAIRYSGLTSPGDYNYANNTGESGLEGPCGGFGFCDTLITPTGAVANSSAFSVAAAVDLPLSPAFKITPQFSYGTVTYDQGSGAKASAIVGGGVHEWTPVPKLVFDLDLLYSSGNFTDAFGVKGNYEGFNGKLRIERDF